MAWLEGRGLHRSAEIMLWSLTVFKWPAMDPCVPVQRHKGDEKAVGVGPKCYCDKRQMAENHELQ